LNIWVGVAMVGNNVDRLVCGPTKQPRIAQARGVIGHMAARELSIPGSEVARRFKQDRSAVSRAAQRVENNEEFLKFFLDLTTLID
jgi:predicted regulator of amino acid metabolism with ACT domain